MWVHGVPLVMPRKEYVIKKALDAKRAQLVFGKLLENAKALVEGMVDRLKAGWQRQKSEKDGEREQDNKNWEESERQRNAANHCRRDSKIAWTAWYERGHGLITNDAFLTINNGVILERWNRKRSYVMLWMCLILMIKLETPMWFCAALSYFVNGSRTFSSRLAMKTASIQSCALIAAMTLAQTAQSWQL